MMRQRPTPMATLPLLLTLAAAICASLSACTTPAVKPDGASALRARLTRLEGDPDFAGRAPLTTKDAEQAVTAAEQAQSDPDQGRHLVFMADRKISIAEADARNHYLVDQRAGLSAARTRMQLDERTQEADSANLRAADARADANNQHTLASQADARAASAQAIASDQRQQTDNANMRAADAQAEAGDQHQAADLARSQAAAAQGNAQQLQQQLDELNAKVTDRGTVVTLGDLLFTFGTADLNAGGNQHLGRLAGFLAKYPDRTARIEGYTDNVGSSDYNLGLSQRRAQAVKDYLVSQGISGARLTASGKGKSDPIGDNTSSTGRQQNRRVEVVIANSVISSN